MEEVIDIPGLFKTVAERVHAYFSGRAQNPFDVYFDHGHYDAVNKNLISKDSSITLKAKKFPLIWMVTPFEQRFDRRQDYFCEVSGLDILIMMNTTPDESIEVRTTKYFIPTLRPILQRFKIEIEASGLFQVLSADAIPYDYVKEWHYQSGLSGKQNMFNDYIDAIQIKGLRLRVNETVPDDFQFH